MTVAYCHQRLLRSARLRLIYYGNKENKQKGRPFMHYHGGINNENESLAMKYHRVCRLFNDSGLSARRFYYSAMS